MSTATEAYVRVLFIPADEYAVGNDRMNLAWFEYHVRLSLVLLPRYLPVVKSDLLRIQEASTDVVEDDIDEDETLLGRLKTQRGPLQEDECEALISMLTAPEEDESWSSPGQPFASWYDSVGESGCSSLEEALLYAWGHLLPLYHLGLALHPGLNSEYRRGEILLIASDVGSAEESGLEMPYAAIRVLDQYFSFLRSQLTPAEQLGLSENPEPLQFTVIGRSADGRYAQTFWAESIEHAKAQAHAAVGSALDIAGVAPGRVEVF